MRLTNRRSTDHRYQSPLRLPVSAVIFSNAGPRPRPYEAYRSRISRSLLRSVIYIMVLPSSRMTGYRSVTDPGVVLCLFSFLRLGENMTWPRRLSFGVLKTSFFIVLVVGVVCWFTYGKETDYSTRYFGWVTGLTEN